MVRTSVTAVVILVVLAATCSLADHLTNFYAKLEGAQEVPPVATSDFGICHFVHDRNLSQVDLLCYHNVSSPTAAHIHGPAEIGIVGGVAIPFDSASSPIALKFNLTDELYAEMLAGQFYVNIHNAEHPNGVVRGQIIKAPCVNNTERANDTWVYGRLTGGAQLPSAVNTTATGLVVCHYIFDDDYFGGDDEDDDDRFDDLEERITCIIFHSVANVSSAYIGFGNVTQVGSSRFRFQSADSPIVQSFRLRGSQERALIVGNYHVNIASQQYPNGELRTQLSQNCPAPAPGPGPVYPENLIKLKAALVALVDLAGLPLSDVCVAAAIP